MAQPTAVAQSTVMAQPTASATTDAVDGLLTGPAPPISVQRIDFLQTPLPKYEGAYAVILDNVLTAAECAQLARAASEAAGGAWERAMVNVGMNRQKMITDVRNCDRIIWDAPEVVGRLWARVAPCVPELARLVQWPSVTGSGPAKREETWVASRLNERMRFLRYGPSEYFRGMVVVMLEEHWMGTDRAAAEHCDGTYVTPDGLERSYVTLHLYLNEDGPENRLVGGATTFHSWNLEQEWKVPPKVGRVLMFQHRNLLHSGEEVVEGLKLTMRTDLMFKKADKEPH